MHPDNPTINSKALAWTAGIHTLLILLFVLIHYTVPASVPTEELGMEVNLGTSDEGSGTEQPMDMDDPAPDAANRTRNSDNSSEDGSRSLLDNDDPDAPEVRNTPVTTPNRNLNQRVANSRNRNTPNTIATTQQQRQQQRPRYVYNGGTGRGGNSASANASGGNEGNTSGAGDRGVPGGTPGAANYEGSPGPGTGGINHTLSGRSIFAPPMQADFREGGKVVVRVTVNREGSIVNKQVISSTNGELRGIALQKLSKVRFNKSASAPEEQFGTITFVFKTRS